MSFDPYKEITACGIVIGVYHPDSDTSETTEHYITNPDDGQPITLRRYDETHADEDGHRVIWSIHKMAEYQIANVQLRHGTDARYAAALLRKLAVILENNPRVMNQPLEALGEIRDGKAIRLRPDSSGWDDI